jgi:chaperonin cofactor prefoldin
METKVLTEEELQSLKDFQTKQNNLIFSLGQIEYQIALLEINKQNLKEEIKDIEKSNKELGQQLTQKYGSGKINSDTGEIVIE